MAGKSKAKALAPKRDPNKLVMPGIIGEPEEVTLARTSLLTSVKGAVTIKEYSKGKFGELDLMGLVEDLTDQARAAIDGNLKRAEGMLMIQASTLDTIFNNLAQRAALNMGEYIGAAETYLRLALKAQSQCRATLETLAVIKNPPNVAFVKQANISHNQQVNNAPTIPSRARENARGKMKSRKTNYWRNYPVNGWTSERRARQSALIRTWRPWKKSTGPKSSEGKAKVSRNAFKGGHWKTLRELSRALREQEKARLRMVV